MQRKSGTSAQARRPLEVPPLTTDSSAQPRCSRSHGCRSRAASLGGLGLLARHQVARAAVAASARSLGAHDGQRGRRPGRLRQVDGRLRQGRTTAAAAVPGPGLAASRTASRAAPAPLPRRSCAAPAPLPRTRCTPRVSLRDACLRISRCAGGRLLEDDLPVLPQDQGSVRRPRCQVHLGGARRLQHSPQALTLTVALILSLTVALTLTLSFTVTRALALNPEPRQVELDEMENGPAVQDALLASSGQRTVAWLGLGLGPRFA